ncbi:response regulator [Leifsonia sp. Root112D2]|uniref:response regulator n=1 Tax=Leifsonia sp. Root112D2 TaxID=1736426 RepID=UPI0007022E03|nr:response regulator transcription factor [Leifsonia sp. Root112D2]KQV07783.1 LuxR family transcriptional regulator [Leifsonia sp. Root112D2]
MTAIRILLVDDQALVRMGFRMVLDAEPDLQVVGEASDGEEAVRLAASEQPDVVLMDVRMPRLDGIEATRRIIAARPESRVIILTTFDLDEYAFGGLRAGASGFLLKDARPAELLGAIRSVVSGDAVISGRVTRKMLELFSTQLPTEPAPGTDASPDAAAALTPREREVLLAIGEGLTNAELATRLFLTESTVKTHVGRVLQKLGLRDRVQAVIFAYENGLVRR